MTKKTRLELTWVGKQDRPRLEPRILIEQPEYSRPAEDGSRDNVLIHGDNLMALKAIEADYRGRIKCIFIDPPYNSGAAFTHYDDGLEHSTWLNLMYDRIILHRELLSEDGSMWVTIGDDECHYLKVMMDEIFGRKNFVCSFAWEKDKGRRNDTDISSAHDHILLYAKNRDIWAKTRNTLKRTDAQLSRYRNPDNDPRGPWLQGDNGTAKSGSASARYPITLPSGRVVTPPEGNYWRFSKATFEKALQENRVYFGRDGNGMPLIKRYLSDVKEGVVPRTWLPGDEAGTNQDAKRDHLRKLLPEIEPFATPKPEQLLQHILHIATNPGDIVLDSFGGSGTTAAVAQKMGRRWIMIELGHHCFTHILPRLEKVISGDDPGGITGEVNWKGGGGFRFYRLAPSMLEKDTWGNWIISKEYNSNMLAEALCKHMGFTFAPSQNPTEYWNHGFSTENDFIYVTTQALTSEMLNAISSAVGPDRHLLICCKAFSGPVGTFENLTIKKIPAAIFQNCEWGRDDYSLNITSAEENVIDSDEADDAEVTPIKPAQHSLRNLVETQSGQPSLFDESDDISEG